MVLGWIPLAVTTFYAIWRLPRLATFCPKNPKPYTKAIYNLNF